VVQHLERHVSDLIRVVKHLTASVRSLAAATVASDNWCMWSAD
jgi:hypothetical protein